MCSDLNFFKNIFRFFFHFQKFRNCYIFKIYNLRSAYTYNTEQFCERHITQFYFRGEVQNGTGAAGM